MATVVITGCSLVDPAHNSEQHGDLWFQGDNWIFNAVANPWQYEGTPRDPKYLAYDSHSHYFERRNVFVIPMSESALSPEAEAYVIRHFPQFATKPAQS